MIWIECPDKLAAMCRPGESYTDSMISIPITDEAYEALKARNPQIDQDQTSRGRPERSAAGSGWIGRSSTSFSAAAAIPTAPRADGELAHRWDRSLPSLMAIRLPVPEESLHYSRATIGLCWRRAWSARPYPTNVAGAGTRYDPPGGPDIPALVLQNCNA